MTESLIFTYNRPHNHEHEHWIGRLQTNHCQVLSVHHLSKYDKIIRARIQSLSVFKVHDNRLGYDI